MTNGQLGLVTTFSLSAILLSLNDMQFHFQQQPKPQQFPLKSDIVVLVSRIFNLDLLGNLKRIDRYNTSFVDELC